MYPMPLAEEWSATWKFQVETSSRLASLGGTQPAVNPIRGLWGEGRDFPAKQAMQTPKDDHLSCL
jgi:hypothetical protein